MENRDKGERREEEKERNKILQNFEIIAIQLTVSPPPTPAGVPSPILLFYFFLSKRRKMKKNSCLSQPLLFPSFPLSLYSFPPSLLFSVTPFFLLFSLFFPFSFYPFLLFLFFPYFATIPYLRLLPSISFRFLFIYFYLITYSFILLLFLPSIFQNSLLLPTSPLFT